MGYITQLRFTDLEEAIRFYTENLGGELVFRHEDFYAGLLLDGQMIHFKLVDEPDPNVAWVEQGNHVHLSIEVENIDDLHADLEARGVRPSELQRQPWGVECHFKDPGGHTIYFRQTPAT